MNNDWIEFHETGYEEKRRNPRVLLTKERVFRLNRKAIELLGRPKAVAFRFDVGRGRIGIRVEEPGVPHAFPARLQDKRGYTTIIHGAQFCSRFGIKPESTIEFDGVRLDDDGTMILDLATARRR
ncbi:MAG: hypothetical protein ABL984_04930 [Pyrinomonadaceae bacterium]